MLALVITMAWANDAFAESSYTVTSSNGKVVLTITGDANDLSDLTSDQINTLMYAKNLVVIGKLSAIGYATLSEKIQYQNGNVNWNVFDRIDLSNAEIEGGITTFGPLCCTKIIFPKGYDMPNTSELEYQDGEKAIFNKNGNLAAVYVPSADGTTVTIHIPAGRYNKGQNNLTDNDASDEILTSATNIKVSGTNAAAVVEKLQSTYRNATVELYVPKVHLFSDAVEVEGGKVSELTQTNVNSLEVTGTLTAEDVAYIKEHLTSLKNLDLTNATLAEGVSYSDLPSTLEGIALPSGETSVPDLTSITSLKFAFGENAGAYINNVTGGGLQNFVASIPSVIKNSTKIAFAGNYDYADLSQIQSLFSSLTEVANFANANVVEDALQNNLQFANSATPAIILPTSWTEEETKKYVDSKTSGSNIYWLTDSKKNLNVKILDQNKLSKDVTASALVKGITKNIVLYGSFYNASIIKNFDVEGIDNLDLHYTTCTPDGLSALNDYTNIKRIILPNNNDVSASKWESYEGYEGSVEVLQSLIEGTEGNTFKTNIVKAGGFGRTTHYDNADLVNAICVDVYGTADDSDFEFIAGIDNERINMSGLKFDATIADEPSKKAAIDKINKNTNVKFLALPDVGSETTDPLFKNLYDNMPQLVGVAYYYKAGHSYSCYTTTPGTAIILTNMTKNETNINSDIKKLKVSGKLNAKDISQNANFDENGHFEFVGDVEETDGNPRAIKEFSDKNGAFDGARTLECLDLADAKFANAEDMTLSATGIAGSFLHEVYIPTDESVKEIPADFLNGSSNVESIMIPNNIEKIGARAFRITTGTFKHISTNDKGMANDHGYVKMYKTAGGSFTTDSTKEGATLAATYGTFTFSENLKEIQSFAFVSSAEVCDIYNHATVAPECHVNAFSSVTCTGNNGFNVTDPMTRFSWNKGEHNTYAVLRFPEGTDDQNVKRYTDPTREYSINIGEIDAKGNTIMYPTMAEWNRSYVQGTYGYLWNAWDPTRIVSGNSLAIGYDGIGNDNDGKGTPINVDYMRSDQKTANDFYRNNKVTAATKADNIFWHTSYNDGETSEEDVAPISDPKTYDKDYRGWHQIVLTAFSSNSKEDHHKFNPETIKDNEWWTICLPYNLTNDELIQAYGDADKNQYPKLCEFVGVERDVKNESITLQFGPDLVKPANGSDIVLHKGHPYMIKPYLNIQSDGTISDKDAKKRIIDYVETDPRFEAIVIPSPTVDNMEQMLQDNTVTVKATLVNNEGANAEDAANPIEYTFVGSFFKWALPSYCYFLGWNEANKRPAFYYNHYAIDEAKAAWNTYTAVIIPKFNKQDPVFYNPTGSNAISPHWTYAAKNGTVDNIFCGSDDFKDGGPWDKDNPGNENVRSNKIKMLFGVEPGTVNGIKEIKPATDDAENVINGNSRVYNISGQYVGNSLEGLSKGIYIVNGKKYVVK